MAMPPSFAIFVLLIAFVASTQALACSQQWECSSVTTDYNYVQCASGQCKCLTSKGFIGAATTTDKCRCASPNTITWQSGSPYCLNFDNAVALQNNASRCTILKAKAKSLYDSLIWPVPASIIYALITGGTSVGNELFATVANGRVDPAGEFHDFAGFVEYFYGTIWAGYTQVQNVVYHVLNCEGNKVTVRVDIYFVQYTVTDPPAVDYVYNLTQSGILSFDDDNLIIGTELIIHNIGKISDPKTPADALTPEGLQFTPAVVCGIYTQQTTCGPSDDPTGYYTDFMDCYTFLTSIEHGSWNDLRSDTAICRQYHVLLAIVDKMHCAHAGKTGGGKCIDRTYESYYDNSYIF